MARSPEDETLDYYTEKARSLAQGAGPDSAVDQPLETDALRQFTQYLKAGSRVLDAGCGPGHHLRYFLEHGFQAEGFDGSSEVLQLAEQNLRPWLESSEGHSHSEGISTSFNSFATTSPPSASQLKLWKADFRFLSLSKEHYDGIWANRVLIHLPPPGCQRVMQAFFSALKPGGILFVSFEAKSESKPQDETASLSLGTSQKNSSAISQVAAQETSQENFARITERDDLLGPARHLYQYPPLEFESLVRQSGFQPFATGHDLQHPERMAILAKRI
jgi:SAM-dependent methyltransferase